MPVISVLTLRAILDSCLFVLNICSVADYYSFFIIFLTLCPSHSCLGHLFHCLLMSFFHSNLSSLPSVHSAHHHPISIPEIEPLCCSSLRNLSEFPLLKFRLPCLLFRAFHGLTQHTCPKLSRTNPLHECTTPARSLIHVPEVLWAFFSCVFFLCSCPPKMPV